MPAIKFIQEYWHFIAGSGLGFPALLFAVWRLIKRWAYARWTSGMVESYRRSGTSIQVFLHERERLAWAVKEGRLCVVGNFKGGWLVAEQMQLSIGPGVST